MCSAFERFRTDHPSLLISDLVFVQDATGSMGSYIASGKPYFGCAYEADFLADTTDILSIFSYSKHRKHLRDHHRSREDGEP